MIVLFEVICIYLCVFFGVVVCFVVFGVRRCLVGFGVFVEFMFGCV